ncbi:MAG: hypothetical protein HY921_01840 [Elusimicrobia bacterium]|nr:hypothetical protein [Elusimicrobiota bacterium]
MVVVAAILVGLPWPLAAAPLSLEPPPGWQDVTAERGAAGVEAVLKGPQESSFVLARTEGVDWEDRGTVKAFLVDVLKGLNERSGGGFTLASSVLTATFDNGLTAYYIRAYQKGEPRLILALIRYRGLAFLGSLMSSVPDTMLGSILGSLQGGASARAEPAAGLVQSLDGQFSFKLPPDFSSRELLEREKKMGFVLSLRAWGSELMIMRLMDEGTPLREQAAIVRATVLAAPGAVASSLSGPSLGATSAGPRMVYAWVRVRSAKEGPQEQFAAGYLPWGYWGYSLLAKGPRALDLLQESVKTVALGPSALPKIVADTPDVPLKEESVLKGKVFGTAAVILVLAVLALARAYFFGKWL